VKRPHILVDVDGVLADFVGAVLLRVNRLGLRVRIPQAHELTTWEIFDSLPPECQEFKHTVYQDIKSVGGCSSIKVYPGAKEGMAALREIADVTIVTSPFKGSRTWVHEREEWLEEHFGITHKDVIHTGKKHLVQGDFFVDDKSSHIQDWVDHNIGKAVVWDQPYNRNVFHGRAFRAKNWNELLELVGG